MSYMASPGGLLLLGILAVTIVLGKSPGWQRQVRTLSCVILVCILIGIIYEVLYNRLLLGGVNNQFSAYNMLRRLYPPALTEFARFNALLFPSGFLPAISLLLVRRKDPEAWALSGVTFLFFVVLYLQAWTSLHQFTPVNIVVAGQPYPKVNKFEVVQGATGQHGLQVLDIID